MKIHLVLVLGGLVAATVSAREARAQGAISAATDVHAHQGLFTRVALGPAGFDSQATFGSDKYEISGGGAGFSLAVGWAVTPQLVIYGEVFDDVAVGPTLKMNDMDVGTSGGDVSAGVVGIGPGVAYYFPSNLYVSATLAASRLTVQQGGMDVAHTDTGFGVSAMVGKEWWVTQKWGVGVGGQLYVGSIPDSTQGSPSWTTAGAMLAFSATYN